MVLSDGCMVEYGPTDNVLDDPKHPYTKDILNNKSKQISTDSTKSSSYPGCNYADRCNFVTTICYSKKPQQTLIDNQIVSCHNVIEINSN